MTSIALSDLWSVTGGQYAAPGKEPTCASIEAAMSRASTNSKLGLTYSGLSDMYSLVQQHNIQKCPW